LQLAIKLKQNLDAQTVSCIRSEALGLSNGGPMLHFIDRKTMFVGVSMALGFWSMRHSAISEEEVDFQEHYVRILASVCVWALSK
jgi:hypothetical protein